MKCPYCGAETQSGQRFCTACGGNLLAAKPEEKPKLDLSEYFDRQPEAEKRPAQKQSPLPAAPTPAPRPQPAPGKKPETPQKKTDRGLNLLLMIALVLAVAVVTFVLLILFLPNENPGAPRYDTGAASPASTSTVIWNPSPAPAASDRPTEPVATAAPTAAPTATPAPTAEPASEYLLPESNSRYLTESDLSGLSHEQLCLARNEIFARHGRIFATPQIAAYFNGKSWYRGTVSGGDFQDSVLNEYERANISLIADYENRVYGGSYY